ncbi:MAG: kelch repeat-containing protein [Bacteroidota bacterium]
MKVKNNKCLLGSIMVGLLIISYSCSDDDSDDRLGNWAERSTFNEEPRSSSTAFTVGNRGYMGTGFDGDDYLSDFWAYDMDSNSWQQLADFPGMARSSAVSFAIGGDGYLGTGFNGDVNEELSDFYRYNIASNSWSPIADFGGTPRYGAVAFASDNSGYVGTGFDGDGDKKDFFKYNPLTDTWEEQFGFGGDKRRDGTVFTIGTNVYLCTGVSNGILQEDFWVFDTLTETWTSLEDVDDTDDDILRSNAVGFSIDGRGYIACGESFGATDTVWEYNPDTEDWDQKTSFEFLGRQDPIAFSNGERAFVALGRNGVLYLDDNMEFFPFDEQDDDDN